MSKPNWMNEEDNRAKAQAKTPETTNAAAPRLVRKEYAPERKQKAFYIQPCYAEAFEDFIIKQRRTMGKDAKKATQIAEEMIKDVLNKYGEDTSNLP
jgi:cAMP phosphodiesterase